MDLKDIKAIIDLMKKNSISEFELEKTDFKIRLKRGVSVNPPAAEEYTVAGLVPQTNIGPAPLLSNAAAAAAAVPSGEIEIKSPMVGTFYPSPSPDQPSFVKVGDRVEEGTIVCIIEAMKVMNEVKAGVSGTVAEVYVENAHPVEFGTKILRIV